MDRTPKRGNHAKTSDSVENVRLAQHVRAALKTGQYVEETWNERQNAETGKNTRLRGKPPTSAARAHDAENWPIRCRNMDRTPKRGNRAKTPESTENVRLA